MGDEEEHDVEWYEYQIAMRDGAIEGWRKENARLEAAIRKHYESTMDDCVMSETDPSDHDLSLWGNIQINVSAAF